MPFWKLSLLIAALCASKAPAADSAPTFELINNQPFPIRMPMEIRHFDLPNTTFVTSDHRPVQPLGSNLMFIAEAGAMAERRLTLSAGSFQAKPALTLRPV